MRPDCQIFNSSDVFLFRPELIFQFYSGFSIVYFKEIYNFPRFQRGSNIFQGGGGGLAFSRGGPTFSRGVGSKC